MFRKFFRILFFWHKPKIIALPYTMGLKKWFKNSNTLNNGTLQQLENQLIQADTGVTFAHKVINALPKTQNKEDIQKAMNTFMINQLNPYVGNLLEKKKLLTYYMFTGLNGSGKTTTIAKVAHLLMQQKQKPLLAAGDMFRAGAKEQLTQWADRLKIPIYKKDKGDSAAIAYGAYDMAIEKHLDCVLLDTAGRLHTNQNLMDEIKKVKRVLQKKDPQLPHYTVMVLDGTIGQNALNQVKMFQESITLSGLIVTKLDGTAKGGILFNLCDTFHLPVYGLGMGEQPDNFNIFSPKQFVEQLLS